MTGTTIPARADDAAYLRWIFVLGLAHAHRHGLRPASLPSLACHALDVHGAAVPVI